MLETYENWILTEGTTTVYRKKNFYDVYYLLLGPDG
jgi:hypothetical protein